MNSILSFNSIRSLCHSLISLNKRSCAGYVIDIINFIRLNRVFWRLLTNFLNVVVFIWWFLRGSQTLHLFRWIFNIVSILLIWCTKIYRLIRASMIIKFLLLIIFHALRILKFGAWIFILALLFVVLVFDLESILWTFLIVWILWIPLRSLAIAFIVFKLAITIHTSVFVFGMFPIPILIAHFFKQNLF